MFLKKKDTEHINIWTSKELEVDGIKCFLTHIERMNKEKEFVMASVQYPGLFIQNNIGFSEEEIEEIKDFVEKHEEEFWKMAREDSDATVIIKY